jgi:hypothetical protein
MTGGLGQLKRFMNQPITPRIISDHKSPKLLVA